MTKAVALAGNPNSGKTTLFNRLTGLNQKVGNYPGITVERRSGRMQGASRDVRVIDLPGTYSLVPRSREETVAFDALMGRTSDGAPDLAIVVVDASNLGRNLYLALSILELGIPTIVALNMVDLASARGRVARPDALSLALGVRVVPVVATTGAGVADLVKVAEDALATPPRPGARLWRGSTELESALLDVRGILAASVQEVNARSERREQRRAGGLAPPRAHRTCACGPSLGRETASETRKAETPSEGDEGVATWLLATMATRSKDDDDPLATANGAISAAARAIEEKLGGRLTPLSAEIIEARFKKATEIAESTLERTTNGATNPTHRLDAWLLHPIAGTATFVAVMAVLFQSIFLWADPLMGAIESAIAFVQTRLRGTFPSGAVVDLFADGIVGGVGNVLVFIPQIAILFMFIAVLEDSGYLARAAFISDRAMARIGLHGRAFVPLLSGFACAVPAVMAARSIESRRDRLVTILVAPMVSCSARLPVYTLIIAVAFSSATPVLGFLSFGGLVLLAMYALSIVATIAGAFILKRTILASPTPPLVLELPPYRMPEIGSVVRRAYERCVVFLRDAGTVILACSIVLWALLYFPRAVPPESDQLAGSVGGHMGHAIEPLIAPLGFDWRIGIGLLGSFAAREVFVSTLGLVYGVGGDVDEENASLRDTLGRATNDTTGKKTFTPLVGISLMIFFVLSCQCMSTIAVVRRETNSWRWPLFMFGYMTVLAWVASFAVFQGGRLLGLA